jgi:hypothetical protein
MTWGKAGEKTLKKSNGSETVGQVEVEGVHGRPGSPVGVGALVRAFVEIGPPALSFQGHQGACVPFQQVEREEKCESPSCLFLDFRIHPGREGMINHDPASLVRGKGPECLETGLCTCVIGDVGGQKGSPAIEFEIEVSASFFRLQEDLHATVLVYRLLKPRSYATDVPVLHLEMTVQALVIVKQFGPSRWAMIAALRSKRGDLQNSCFTPVCSLPFSLQPGTFFGSVDRVFHQGELLLLPLWPA